MWIRVRSCITMLILSNLWGSFFNSNIGKFIIIIEKRELTIYCPIMCIKRLLFDTFECLLLLTGVNDHNSIFIASCIANIFIRTLIMRCLMRIYLKFIVRVLLISILIFQTFKPKAWRWWWCFYGLIPVLSAKW